jgi:hypothetical protein
MRKETHFTYFSMLMYSVNINSSSGKRQQAYESNTGLKQIAIKQIAEPVYQKFVFIIQFLLSLTEFTHY